MIYVEVRIDWSVTQEVKAGILLKDVLLGIGHLSFARLRKLLCSLDRNAIQQIIVDRTRLRNLWHNGRRTEKVGMFRNYNPLSTGENSN